MVNLRRIRRLRCTVPFPSQLAALLDASDTPDLRHVAEIAIVVALAPLAPAIKLLPKEGGRVLVSSSLTITGCPRHPAPAGHSVLARSTDPQSLFRRCPVLGRGVVAAAEAARCHMPAGEAGA